jgi:hypothetical protein
MAHVGPFRLKDDCAGATAAGGGATDYPSSAGPSQAARHPRGGGAEERPFASLRRLKNSSTQSVEKPVETAVVVRGKSLSESHFVQSALHDSSVTEGHAICVTGRRRTSRL